MTLDISIKVCVKVTSSNESTIPIRLQVNIVISPLWFYVNDISMHDSVAYIFLTIN